MGATAGEGDQREPTQKGPKPDPGDTPLLWRFQSSC